ncbi:MAG TPA: hypothetical protein VLI46_12675 [Ramlibacter sp.]|nr:hypothetical protein [Ramlibacter sp.]
MNTRLKQAGCVGIVVITLACAGPALARNDKLMMPIDAALRGNAGPHAISRDVRLGFGRASADGLEVVNPHIEVRGVADPFGDPGQVRRERRSDAQVCVDAFRKALGELQRRAMSSGAGAVVGIVSNYNKVEMDSRDVYECHAGYSRAVVELKGQAVRGAVVGQPRAQPLPVPPAAVAPLAPAAPMAPAAPAVPLIASGFANIADVDAVPYLSDRGREGYRQYIGRPTPKAFALSASGHWFSAWTLVPGEAGLPSDPVERAVVVCNRTSPTPCRLYAVNGSVVWTREAASAAAPVK